MKSINECFKILGILPTNDKLQIKSAFRQKALSSHPDMLADSSDSNQDFILLRNAFETIMVHVSRPSSEEDAISRLEKTNAAPRSAHSEPRSRSATSDERFAQQLNWLIWDVEELFRNHRKSKNTVYFGHEVLQDILATLVLIDKYILASVGLHDNFMTARNLPPIDPDTYLNVLGSAISNGQHFPYTSVENYFFDIRMRMNTLLGKIDRKSLRLLERWNDEQYIGKAMNAYQNCVYNVSRIQNCLDRDEKFRNDFVEIRAMLKSEI